MSPPSRAGLTCPGLLFAVTLCVLAFHPDTSWALEVRGIFCERPCTDGRQYLGGVGLWEGAIGKETGL